MNNSYGITPDNLLRILPDILRNDKKMFSLATAIADELSFLSTVTSLASIYTHIDALPEEILDTLAVDFKVDWWGYDYSLEEKRRTLKASWFVHRKLGTRSAVERALSAIYENSHVSEWFEYGGEPYNFRLLIDANYESVDPVKYKQVLDRVSFYKNLRSLLEGIVYTVNPETNCCAYAAVATVGIGMTITAEVTV